MCSHAPCLCFARLAGPVVPQTNVGSVTLVLVSHGFVPQLHGLEGAGETVIPLFGGQRGIVVIEREHHRGRRVGSSAQRPQGFERNLGRPSQRGPNLVFLVLGRIRIRGVYRRQ